jgi:5'-nucleotidase/UDP-sugar diphosphatase
LGGSALCEITKGTHVVEILNELGVDAACAGNHEFDFGETVLYFVVIVVFLIHSI